MNELNKQIKPRPIPYNLDSSITPNQMPLDPNKKQIKPELLTDNTFVASSVATESLTKSKKEINPNLAGEDDFYGPDRIETISSVSTDILNKNVKTNGYVSEMAMKPVIPKDGAPIEYNPAKPPKVAAIDEHHATEVTKKIGKHYRTGENPYKGDEIKT
ncbi:MAG: hypothetical protein GX951_04450 [Mollicutes bacterium]|nr:hypothetical protein [Mollicutes bacterium]